MSSPEGSLQYFGYLITKEVMISSKRQWYQASWALMAFLLKVLLGAVM